MPDQPYAPTATFTRAPSAIVRPAAFSVSIANPAAALYFAMNAARRAVAEIIRAIDSLALFPERGNPAGVVGLRDLLVPFGRAHGAGEAALAAFDAKSRALFQRIAAWPTYGYDAPPRDFGLSTAP